MEVNGQWVPCVRNSSYNFIPILQFYSDSFETIRCLDHAFKICMWFEYNPQINFGHIFHNLNLVVFRTFTKNVHVVWIYISISILTHNKRNKIILNLQFL